MPSGPAVCTRFAWWFAWWPSGLPGDLPGGPAVACRFARRPVGIPGGMPGVFLLAPGTTGHIREVTNPFRFGYFARPTSPSSICLEFSPLSRVQNPKSKILNCQLPGLFFMIKLSDIQNYAFWPMVAKNAYIMFKPKQKY